MVERNLGEATIVYDDPDDDTIERTVQNEHVAYFQDHWLVRTGEDDDGNDIVRRIPKERVHYVERSVEEFEEELKTLSNRVQSAAEGLRSKLLGDESASDEDPVRIDVDDDENRT